MLKLTDITEHKVETITGAQASGGKLYLCAIKDAYSNKIVDYSIGSRMKSRLAAQALESAALMRGDVVRCVVLSDRRSQFRNRKFQRDLTRQSRGGSTGRVASCGDNTDIMAYLSLFQKNGLDRCSLDHPRAATHRDCDLD
ncbi:DDE-type integrase/transposase/recombinase [Paramicrobacterium fandaimingii]|uniref:DDE-type integrase/transposase/recombinase n=1 Tax=Paramicrobacterium fandaimingii TaxID=2708079 RepID=UPI001422DF06|nr:DDE-type integrase/transposase/recombinase [Microbacterium fandaimingii]